MCVGEESMSYTGQKTIEERKLEALQIIANNLKWICMILTSFVTIFFIFVVFTI